MSFWSDLFSIFGGGNSKPKLPAPPPDHGVGVAVYSTTGEPVKGAKVTLDLGKGDSNPSLVTPDNGFVLFEPVSASLTSSQLWVTADGFKDFYSHLDLPPNNVNIGVGQKLDAPNISLTGLEPVNSGGVGARKEPRGGVVAAQGRHFIDAEGQFYPLGATLMWALSGWKFEKDRTWQNVQYLSQKGVDYVRILAQVNWPGHEISESWPDYEQNLADFIDTAYDQAKMRTLITIVGGGVNDSNGLVQKIINVVNQRPHKVIYIEVANEWYQNFNDENKLRDLGVKLRGALPNLVALSSPGEDPPVDKLKSFVQNRGVSNMGTVHLDRTDTTNEWKWRHVRKPWESRDIDFAVDHNEPGGPRSSVAEFPEGIHMVMGRLVGLMMGMNGYVIHNAAGVMGIVDPSHNRPANLWEVQEAPGVPSLDEAYRAIRQLDSVLPPNLGDGDKTRKGLGGHVLEADSIWSDGFDHGVIRDYIVTNGNTFVQSLLAIKDYVVLTAHRDVTFDVIDPMTYTRKSFHLANGQTLRLNADDYSKDSKDYAAAIIVGTF